jgi:tRNA threonylcarbamoyladenosine biosynthesis protein TsaB
VSGEELGARLGDDLLGYQAEMFCSALDVAQLAVAAYEQGLAVPPEQALPVYLRNQVAKKAAR